MSTISQRLGIPNEIIEFKFGKSFNSRRGEGSSKSKSEPHEKYHTIRYDFKPASVNTNKPAKIEFNEKNEVTVTAPSQDGASCTVFQGSKKPQLKECVLIIDHETGEITLEKLSSNISVKTSRDEKKSRSKAIQQQQRPITPSSMNGSSKPISPKRSAASTSNGSPIAKSTTKSPPIPPISHTSLRSPAPHSTSQPALNSMPIFSNLTGSVTSNTTTANSSLLGSTNKNAGKTYEDDMLGVLSSSSSEDENDDDSSSSSSSSSSDSSPSSSSDEEDAATATQSKPTNGVAAATAFSTSRPGASMPSMLQSNISDSSSDEMNDSDDDDENLKSLSKNLMNSINNGISNVGLSNGNNGTNNTTSPGFSMPKFSQLNNDLQLSESGSDSD